MPTARLNSSERFLALLNEDNPSADTPFSLSNVTLSNITALSGDASGKNTSILITAIDGQGYAGALTLHYDRVDLADVYATDPTPLEFNGASTIVEALGAFNSKYNTFLGSDDVVDGSLPAADGNGAINFDLTAVSDSVAFIGVASLSLRPPLPALSDAVATTELVGFTVSQVTPTPPSLASLITVNVVDGLNPTQLNG